MLLYTQYTQYIPLSTSTTQLDSHYLLYCQILRHVSPTGDYSNEKKFLKGFIYVVQLFVLFHFFVIYFYHSLENKDYHIDIVSYCSHWALLLINAVKSLLLNIVHFTIYPVNLFKFYYYCLLFMLFLVDFLHHFMMNTVVDILLFTTK